MKRSLRAWLLVERELRRLARRQSTWWVRFGLTALVGAVMWAGWWIFLDDYALTSMSGDIGRPIFITWLVMMWLCLVLLAPVLAAMAMLEEQDESTLELLTLSGIRPVQLVVGTVGSRLVVLITCVLGTVPFLASVLSLGGVAPLEIVTAVGQLVWFAGLVALIAATVAPVMDGLLASAGIAWSWIAVAAWLPAAGFSQATKYWANTLPDPRLMAFLLPMMPTADLSGLGSVLVLFPVVVLCLALQPVAVMRGTGSSLWRRRWESRLHYLVMLGSVLVVASAAAAAWRADRLLMGLSTTQSQAVLFAWIVLTHLAVVGLLLTLTIELVTLQRSRAKRSTRTSRAATMGTNPLWWRAWATDGLSPSRRWTLTAGGVVLILALVGVEQGIRSNDIFNLWLVVGFYASLVVVSLTAAAVNQVDLDQGRGELLRVTTLPRETLMWGQVLSVFSRVLPLLMAFLLPWIGSRLWASWRSARSPVQEEYGDAALEWLGRSALPAGDVRAALSHALDILPVTVWLLVVLGAFTALALWVGQRVQPASAKRIATVLLVPAFVVVQLLLAIMDGCLGLEGVLTLLLLPLIHEEVLAARPVLPVYLTVSTLLWGGLLVLLLVLLVDGWRRPGEIPSRARSLLSRPHSPRPDA